MMEFFYTILYQPLYNLLILIYNLLPGLDVGFAIIALTILIKGLLWPLTSKSLKGQKALQEIQPKIEALKEEHGEDKEKLAKAMMELYSAEKVNPLSSCLPMLIQLPILITLYRVLMSGLEANPADHLYSFIENPGVVDHMFMGFLDLSEPSIYLALIAGAFQFAQTKMLSGRRPPKTVRKKEGAKDEDMLASMNKNMLYFMPVITVVIGANLPGGLTLYWSAVNMISVVQQLVVFRKTKGEKEKESTEIEK